MNILICDDDSNSTGKLANLLTANSHHYVRRFLTSESCQLFLNHHRADVVFLSVCSEKIHYPALLEQLLRQNTNTLVCLLGEQEMDSVNVYRYHCDYYLQKPYSPEAVTECMKRLDLIARQNARIFVQTFGGFDVFIGQTAVMFRNAKAKELFALCIDRRGGTVSIYEAIDHLWPDRSCDEKTKRLYRKAVAAIHATFRSYGVPELFRSVRGGCMACISGIKCDYYSFLDQPLQYLPRLSGEYMKDYEWSEKTMGQIVRIAQQVCDEKKLEFLYE